eukprot:5928035-Lingulodinium_polyedra.AAC.1
MAGSPMLQMPPNSALATILPGSTLARHATPCGQVRRRHRRTWPHIAQTISKTNESNAPDWA